jgi:hypothetical protein
MSTQRRTPGPVVRRRAPELGGGRRSVLVARRHDDARRVSDADNGSRDVSSRRHRCLDRVGLCRGARDRVDDHARPSAPGRERRPRLIERRAARATLNAARPLAAFPQRQLPQERAVIDPVQPEKVGGTIATTACGRLWTGFIAARRSSSFAGDKPRAEQITNPVQQVQRPPACLDRQVACRHAVVCKVTP